LPILQATRKLCFDSFLNFSIPWFLHHEKSVLNPR
jgi:hypothetical protein